MARPRAIKFHEFTAHTAPVSSAAFGQKTGKLLATGGQDGKVNLWRVGQAAALGTLPVLKAAPSCMDFDSSEAGLLVGTEAGLLKLHDLNTLKASVTLKSHRAGVTTVCYHPDDPMCCASGALDTFVKVWDLRSKSESLSLKGHTAEVSFIAFSLDCRLIASGCNSGKIKLWDLTAGKEWASLEGHKAGVTSLHFHPEEFVLASSSIDRCAKVWNLDTLTQISTIPHEIRTVRAVKFSPGGDALFTFTGEGTKTYRVCDGIVDGLDVIDGAWGDTYASTFGGGGGDGLARLLSPPSNLVVAAASANVVTLWGLDLKNVHPFSGLDLAPRPEVPSYARPTISSSPDRHSRPPLVALANPPLSPPGRGGNTSPMSPPHPSPTTPSPSQDQLWAAASPLLSSAVQRHSHNMERKGEGEGKKPMLRAASHGDSELRKVAVLSRPRSAPFDSPVWPTEAPTDTNPPSGDVPVITVPPRARRATEEEDVTPREPQQRRRRSHAGVRADLPDGWPMPIHPAMGEEAQTHTHGQGRAHAAATPVNKVQSALRAQRLIPSSRSQPLGLRYKDFALGGPDPFGSKLAPAPVSPTSILASLREGDDWFRRTITNKHEHVKRLLQLWSEGDVAGCFTLLVQLRNPGLWHDVLRRLSLLSPSVSLDHINIVLPAIADMLSAACDEFVLTGLKALCSVLECYADTICRNRALPLVGVDLAAEDRIQRCATASALLLACGPPLHSLAAKGGIVGVYASQAATRLKALG